jgi:hypothetical protein
MWGKRCDNKPKPDIDRAYLIARFAAILSREFKMDLYDQKGLLFMESNTSAISSGHLTGLEFDRNGRTTIHENYAPGDNIHIAFAKVPKETIQQVEKHLKTIAKSFGLPAMGIVKGVSYSDFLMIDISNILDKPEKLQAYVNTQNRRTAMNHMAAFAGGVAAGGAVGYDGLIRAVVATSSADKVQKKHCPSQSFYRNKA